MRHTRTCVHSCAMYCTSVSFSIEHNCNCAFAAALLQLTMTHQRVCHVITSTTMWNQILRSTAAPPRCTVLTWAITAAATPSCMLSAWTTKTTSRHVLAGDCTIWCVAVILQKRSSRTALTGTYTSTAILSVSLSFVSTLSFEVSDRKPACAVYMSGAHGNTESRHHVFCQCCRSAARFCARLSPYEFIRYACTYS